MNDTIPHDTSGGAASANTVRGRSGTTVGPSGSHYIIGPLQKASGPRKKEKTAMSHFWDTHHNKYSLFPRNTNDADTPVSSGRRQFSALGEVPSTKGPENTRANDEERGGSQCKKERVRPCSVKKKYWPSAGTTFCC